jgi:rhamnogalacturonan endolyase
VDVSCKHYYKSGDPHALDIDIHFVMRRGASGLYVYAVLTHPASYAATTFDEWRMVWQLPYTTTDFPLENIYVDDLRHGLGPTPADFSQATDTGIKEIYYMNTGPLAGQYFGKYQFSADYTTIGCWGHASDINKIGAWVVLGSDEFLNDGPTKQDLTVSERYNLLHFGMDHYDGSSTSLAAGEGWSKTFGPYLLYLNSGANGAACWADAQAQVAAEKSAWPYSWLMTAADYPSAAQRGSVTGRFLVSDPLRPAQTGAGAWIGVSQPDPGGNWQFESKRYEYWTRVGPDGTYTIPHVRPGAYTLSAFVTGEVGEYTGSATVAAGTATNVGDITWHIVHPGKSIAWEIGIADRSADEFRHGSTDYFQGYLYQDFINEFTNPLDYTVGASDWATDWNYAQSALFLPGGKTTAWPWRIHFTLPSLPKTGNATLTLAYAGNDHAHLYLYVNNDSKLFEDIGYPPNGGV